MFEQTGERNVDDARDTPGLEGKIEAQRTVYAPAWDRLHQPTSLPPYPHHPRPWHRGSLFGDGPRRALSADQRRQVLARAELERRAGRVTALHVDVVRALLRRLGEDGQCDPTHATLAADVACSERTVRRALAALRAVGLVAWEQRLVRRPWPAGGAGASRAEQTSNAYVLLLPERPVAPREPRRVRPVQLRLSCGGQSGREILPTMIQKGLPALTEAEERRLDAIKAARKAQREAEWLVQQANRWRGRG